MAILVCENCGRRFSDSTKYWTSNGRDFCCEACVDEFNHKQEMRKEEIKASWHTCAYCGEKIDPNDGWLETFQNGKWYHGKCWEDVKNDITAVRKASSGKILKVIIECCLLTEEEKNRLCDIVSECGADFIKTSTGFSKGGATREDVKLMRERCPETVKVKAAGGISSLQDAKDFLALGAERLGTSRIVKIAMEQSQE